MARLVMCSIRDRIAVVFDRPFFAVSTGSALRGFGDAVNHSDPSSPLALHPDHFDLFHLGFFDDAHATFELLDRPVQLATGTELKRVPGPTQV